MFSSANFVQQSQLAKIPEYYRNTGIPAKNTGIPVSMDLGMQVSVHLSVPLSVNIYPGCLVRATPLTVLYRSF